MARLTAVGVAIAACVGAAMAELPGHRDGRALTPADFEITSLPDLATQPSFKQYSGYMPIGDSAGTEIFFWFVEAQTNPDQAPVALWMNGGPGASSVGYGFWTEHGPFRLAKNASGDPVPSPYEYSWNKIANVLYIEAPKGVGFSFTNDPSGYENITDAESSHDNYMFLLAWFNVFSDFKSNDFYITAESYGGHYGPTLAEQLIDNENSINMKGLLIGNPGINSDWYYNVDEFAFVTFMWSHGLIPAAAYTAAAQACDWANFYTDCTKDYTKPNAACQAATQKATSYVPSPLDIYDVLAPACLDQAGRDAVAELTPSVARYGAKLGIDFNPCLSRLTPTYLNRPDVLKALHADAHYTRTWPSHPQNWGYNQGVAGEKNDIALLFPKFFAKRPDWKIMVVSGTADAAVPFIGTERWMGCLGRKVVNDTRSWKLDGQVAGSVTDWDGISLVTVKGCGHMIPLYCPEAGFAFFANWLSGQW